MGIGQQSETLGYFREHAEDWRKKANAQDLLRVNVIQQRNGFVLHVIKSRVETRSALDVGSGTGDLVCAIARLGISATGIDFADEMIRLGRQQAEQNRLVQADFHCGSIFDFDLTTKRYDLISANGFIEYITPAQLEQFLDLAQRALKPGGSLVLGSRNRLFNMVSINAFTLEELTAGAADLLLREAVALAGGASLDELAESDTVRLQDTETTHPYTGVGVSTRFQYTPVQLMKLVIASGLCVEQIYPVHIHGVPPAFKQQQPEVHVAIANRLQEFALDGISLVPYASTFMLHARKE
ncbi:class I SAM-dependent methyltransferase [Singulisphaera sp. Ch08]|uniref:Class I SAM-dependent methyltransferase n=1 Tax=Singulisphaera sp. Ch08 TaxID=3120278 RepID=A0AAU7CPX6_9BACT